MKPFDQLADDTAIEKAITSLKKNGIEGVVVDSGIKAKEKALSLIPQGAEVMTMSSTTLDTIGLSEEINKKGSKFNPVRDKLYAMDQATQALEMNRLGAAPAYALGSVHAVTEDGHLLIASNTGSQLPAYVYAASQVIWVVGTQKIVKDTDEGIKRIYEYVLPLESQRANEAYNITTGSNVNKLLIVNKEVKQGRLVLIFVKEKLGF